MRAKKLILMATAVVASFSSCTYDDLGITAHEEYTRNFIKEFGLIDPAQDWNLAEGTKVTVKVGDTPAHVKAYMKVDDTYYLVADLESVSGTLDIPFDMPEGTRDIMVKINGTRYFTAPGGTVDPAAPASRKLLYDKDNNTFAGVEVIVEENQKGRVLTLTQASAKEVIDFLPEETERIEKWSQSNIDRVTDNFSLTGKEFYLFPEFWNTSKHSVNIIGIYWEVEPNTEGAEHIERYPAGKYYWDYPKPTPEFDCWIMRVPFIQGPADFYKAYQNEKDEDGNVVGKKELKIGGNSSEVANADFYESKGIHVKFNKEITFGFYLQQGEYIMYSESKFNEYVKKKNKDGEDEYRKPSYVATFLNETDTEGNDKRHLCFEDWYNDNWDLNDMVFRVYGFDRIADGSMETGKVVDIDKPDGDNDTKDPTIKETDTPYNWLVAIEDLGATDDFDFNDVIIGVSAVTVTVEGDMSTLRVVGTSADNTYKKVTFKALAAGGTMNTYVFYGEEKLYPDGQENRSEWHAWFGDGGISSATMINTGHGLDNQAGATCTIYFGDGKFSLGEVTGVTENFNNQFKIGIDKAAASNPEEVSKYYFDSAENYFVEPANPGEAPQMFLIPDSPKWEWPTERTHISVSYPSFKNWVTDKNTNTDWYTGSGYKVCRPTKE